MRRFAVFMLAFFAVWTARATLLFRIDAAVPVSIRPTYAVAVKFLLWIVPAALFVRAGGGNPTMALRITTPIRGAGLRQTLAPVALVFGGMIAIEHLTGGGGAHLTTSPKFLIIAAATAAPSAVLEEVFFRGFVMGQLEAVRRFWTANLVAALLFVLIHWPHWIWRDGFDAGMLLSSASVAGVGLLCGYVARVTNSIWPAAAVHVLNNVIAAAADG